MKWWNLAETQNARNDVQLTFASDRVMDTSWPVHVTYPKGKPIRPRSTTGVEFIAGMPTWNELMKKLQALEEEKVTVAREAASAAEQMRIGLQQSEQIECQLRRDISAFQQDSIRKQHAALKTSLYSRYIFTTRRNYSQRDPAV